jgi:hypothetical protein
MYVLLVPLEPAIMTFNLGGHKSKQKPAAENFNQVEREFCYTQGLR